MIYLSLLVTFGTVLHIVENVIPVPFPVPGAKLGLANIISLLTIVMYGAVEGLTVNILRCIIGALISGSLSSILYSLSGAVFSTLIMSIVYRHFNNIFSLIGISVIGGVVHNFTQVTVASLILSTWGLYIYLPFLMIVGLYRNIYRYCSRFYKRSYYSILERLNKDLI